MIISSGHLFGKQISASGGMPANVYFDNGQFNTRLIPDGFDFINNVQRTPRGAMGAGEDMIIQQGYMEQYVYSGAILGAYGGGGYEFELDGEGMKHINDKSYYPSNYFWTTYFLPILRYVALGYTKICFTLATSCVGNPPPSSIGYHVGFIYHDPSYDQQYNFTYFSRKVVTGYDDSGSTALTERTITIDYSDVLQRQNVDIPYIWITAFDAGTYVFKKIWFE